MAKEFFIFDTETTGLSPSNADLIEFSALKVKSYNKRNDEGKMETVFEVLDEIDFYVNPGYKLPDNIVDFNKKNNTGIDDNLLREKGLRPEAAAQKVVDFLGKDPVLVGHNSDAFDIGFVNKLLGNIGEQLTPKATADTLKIARQVIRNSKKGDLKLCNLFEKTDKTYSNNSPKFHTSIADCYATLDVLDYLIKEYAPKIQGVNKSMKDENMRVI